MRALCRKARTFDWNRPSGVGGSKSSDQPCSQTRSDYPSGCPVELPDRPEPRDRWLSRIEAARIIRTARTPQARLLPSAFHSGSASTPGRRKEAILSLRWPQVDLQARNNRFLRSPVGRRTNKRRGIVPHSTKATGPICSERGDAEANWDTSCT